MCTVYRQYLQLIVNKCSNYFTAVLFKVEDKVTSICNVHNKHGRPMWESNLRHGSINPSRTTDSRLGEPRACRTLAGSRTTQYTSKLRVRWANHYTTAPESDRWDETFPCVRNIIRAYVGFSWYLHSPTLKVNFEIYIADRKATTCI